MCSTWEILWGKLQLFSRLPTHADSATYICFKSKQSAKFCFLVTGLSFISNVLFKMCWRKQKLYLNRTQTILSNYKLWKSLPSIVQIYADFSGEVILVAIFWSKRHLKAIRLNPEEAKIWTAFYCEVRFHKSLPNYNFNTFPIYFYICCFMWRKHF